MLGGCASSYHAKAASAHHAYFRGDYERAAKLIDKVNPSRRDRLLHLLDRGMILHAAGRYEESNGVLTEAEELADALYARSLTREVAATLWSEEARSYHGERHERAMIPTIRMLNYIMLDQWEEALVEVRRLNTTIDDVYGSEHEYDNAFSLYLSAVIWESLGQINDALIDYKRIAKGKADVPYVGHDLAATSRRLGMPVRLPPKGSVAWEKNPRYRKGAGELVVIASTGRSPRFVSDWVSTGFFTVSMPTMIAYEPRVAYATVSANGEDLGQTHPFYNIADDIVIALKERAKRSLIRKMVKLSVQTGLYTAGMVLMDSDDTKEQLAGLALSILAMSMAATDKADERSWRTLPATYQIGRFYLRPGEYEIEVAPEGGGEPITSSVTISKGRPAVILARFGDVGGVASRRGAKEDAASAELRAEERELLMKIRANPKDGNLRLSLAEKRVEGGNYDIEALATQGMRLGGSRQKGISLLVVALTVEGEYAEAARWAEKGAKVGLGSQYRYYGAALKYMAASANTPPGHGPQLTGVETRTNAFNHYIAGLMDARSLDYEEATENFAKAYEYGLVGKPVMERIVENYKKTDEGYKESKEGVDVVTDFADSFVGNL